MEWLAFIATLVGEWHGTKRLYLDPPLGLPLSSASRMNVTPVAGGNFLQLTYDWTYEAAPQTGLLLFGYDEGNVASAAWIDSFHMSAKVMPFAGAPTDDGSVVLLGSYAAPPGPDWGWRITIRSAMATEFTVVMHNISPEGPEDVAVQLDYTRAA